MDQIRVWTVKVEGDAEVFNTLDVAVAYLRAEIKSGRQGGSIESSFVDPEEYVRLTDGQRVEDLEEEARGRMCGICAELAGAI